MLPSSFLKETSRDSIREAGTAGETEDGIKGAATEAQASQEDPWFKDASVGTKRGLQICGKTGEHHINRGLNK